MDAYSELRHRMVERQIQRRGLTDPHLLRAFEEVPRHLFVPEQDRSGAYQDMPLPIGHSQTISQPYIVALMISLLALDGSERVLEVGTGSGYEAALLGRMAAEVHTIESIPELGQSAAQLLNGLGYTNVHVHVSDGTLGWVGAAPYRGIVCAAFAPAVPPPLLQQLSDGGRLILPVADEGQQVLKLIVRHGDRYDEQVLAGVAFVPLRGKHGWQ